MICGRATKYGETCRRVLLWYETACHNHATAEDDRQATDRLRIALAQRLEHEYCPCPCHSVVQDGLVLCPRCAP